MTYTELISLAISPAVSSLRLISCLMIVSCHFLQAYSNDWAFVLNTGVQAFLLISGLLYGIYGISDVKSFYSKRIKKVYVPYRLWTAIITILLIIFAPEHITYRRVVAQILMLGTLDGQSHLWFIPILFLCYLILPIIASIRSPRISFLVIVSLITILFCGFAVTGEANLLWIATYFIGYMLGRYSKIIKYISLPIIVSLLFLLCRPDIIEMFQDKTLIGRGVHILFAIGLLLLSVQLVCLRNLLSVRILPPPEKYQIRPFVKSCK